MSVEQAIKHIKDRDENNRKRYKKVYGIDIYNIDEFDACFNSGIYTPDKLLKIVLTIIKTKGGNRNGSD